MSWACPRCDRTFRQVNQRHACGSAAPRPYSKVGHRHSPISLLSKLRFEKLMPKKAEPSDKFHRVSQPIFNEGGSALTRVSSIFSQTFAVVLSPGIPNPPCRHIKPSDMLGGSPAWGQFVSHAVLVSWGGRNRCARFAGAWLPAKGKLKHLGVCRGRPSRSTLSLRQRTPTLATVLRRSFHQTSGEGQGAAASQPAKEEEVFASRNRLLSLGCEWSSSLVCIGVFDWAHISPEERSRQAPSVAGPRMATCRRFAV